MFVKSAVILVIVVVNLKNAGVVLMTENFESDGREGKKKENIFVMVHNIPWTASLHDIFKK